MMAGLHAISGTIVETKGMRRRLAAIMSADVVGYSALMAVDEEGTLARLKAHREELVEPTIAAHEGRVVKLMGDGLLVEFPSVVEAVRAAVEVQRGMAERNADTPEEQRITFRIGVNQGDVIVDGDDIYGDGVNVAARLQERATPGGICISDRVHGDIRGRIDVGIDDLGDQELKNIPQPVRVFRVLTGPDSGSRASRALGSRRVTRRLALAASAALVGGIAGLATWTWFWSPAPADPDLAHATRPSIAVLPFSNLGKPGEDEYFSDGITNDLINDLSKFRDLLVIASNSVFTYKGKAVKVQEVGRDLGVRYVLEGSVRKSSDRVRINTQLVDTTTGRQLWAERYDEAVEDIFDLQEKIARRIVRTLAVQLSEIENRRAFAKPTSSLKAYDYVLRGRALIRRGERQENFQAREMFRRAIELDPDFASAHAGLGWTYINAMLFGWTESAGKAIDRAEKLARKSLALSESNLPGHELLARVYVTRQQYDLAIIESERVIAINPNDADGYAEQGNVLLWSGRTDGAILALETAARFDPGMNPTNHWLLAVAYYLKQRYSDAITLLERNIRRRKDNAFDHVMLVASYAQTGRSAEAAQMVEIVRRIDPFLLARDFTLFRNQADTEKVADGLRKAGLQ